MRPWILAETNYGYTKDHKYEVAVLPLGATEPHNFHLPYGTDVFEGTIVGEKICEAAHHRGAKVALLPTIPYGTETNMHAFPLAMNVNPSTGTGSASMISLIGRVPIAANKAFLNLPCDYRLVSSEPLEYPLSRLASRWKQRTSCRAGLIGRAVWHGTWEL